MVGIRKHEQKYGSSSSDIFKLKIKILLNLQYLTFCENPIALHPDYRSKIVWALPSLCALDEHVVCDVELKRTVTCLLLTGEVSLLFLFTSNFAPRRTGFCCGGWKQCVESVVLAWRGMERSQPNLYTPESIGQSPEILETTSWKTDQVCVAIDSSKTHLLSKTLLSGFSTAGPSTERGLRQY